MISIRVYVLVICSTSSCSMIWQGGMQGADLHMSSRQSCCCYLLTLWAKDQSWFGSGDGCSKATVHKIVLRLAEARLAGKDGKTIRWCLFQKTAWRPASAKEMQMPRGERGRKILRLGPTRLRLRLHGRTTRGISIGKHFCVMPSLISRRSKLQVGLDRLVVSSLPRLVAKH
ncbi:hypothetical protein BO82DRAFT_190238 [Aspergillus uvarum CBS 121591]|uniref:Secreted protein n=1 Tax=Aspergillus uvarum CBS 121591 TaxID=1448315 RepID=A0A319BY19_9EURO|nr:hypothetical protein BO82DRAFT_190238 [Aspergillus uvarum CBS 121591]PYH77057.1 hypothetical protein BO82DRAFT_190238 [Aspergillus uvarum CBS 121591]